MGRLGSAALLQPRTITQRILAWIQGPERSALRLTRKEQQATSDGRPAGSRLLSGLELDLFSQWHATRWSPTPQPARDARWAPSMDICESADQFTVTLELAGGRKDDITIELHGDVMTIRGEKRNEREQAEEQPCYVERTYGRFSRSLPLPAKADQQALHSHFADGVLSIEIPKRTQGQTGAITTNRAR